MSASDGSVNGDGYSFGDGATKVQRALAEKVGHGAESTPGDGAASSNGAAAERYPDNGGRLRHPEDPPEGIARAAAEVGDPDLIRGSLASDLGKSLQAVEGTHLFGPLQALVRRVEAGIAGIRKGAVVIPAQRATGEQLAITGTTESEQELERAKGQAATAKAERLKVELAAELAKLDRSRAAVAEAREGLDSARAARAVVRDDSQDREPAPDPSRKGSGFEWLTLPPWVAVLVGLIDLAVTIVLLEGPLSDLVPTTIPNGPIYIAAGVGASVLAAAGIAGFALAAARPPGRIVGAAAIGLVALIGVKFVPALDAARAGEAGGVEMLTSATLFACLVAAMTAYSGATYRLHQGFRDDASVARGPLADAEVVVAEAEERLRLSEQSVADREERRAALESEIEDLRDLAAKTEVRVREREAAGIRAKAQLATISGICASGVSQEDHSSEAAIAAAELAWRKTRAEELPVAVDEQALEAVRVVEAPSDNGGRTGLGLLVGAIAVLVGSALGGALIGSVALAVAGSGIAILLLLLGIGLSRRRRESSTTETTRRAPDDVPSIRPAVDWDSAYYYPQPDRMGNKYVSADHDPALRQ